MAKLHQAHISLSLLLSNQVSNHRELLVEVLTFPAMVFNRFVSSSQSYRMEISLCPHGPCYGNFIGNDRKWAWDFFFFFPEKKTN